MKGFGFFFMLFLAAAACVYIAFINNGIGSTTINEGMVSIDWRNGMPLNIKRRKLKGNKNTNSKNGNVKVGLEDYRAIDPIPSSTSSIKPGPIQHGTPLFPYIPEPSSLPPPPTQPKQNELP